MVFGCCISFSLICATSTHQMSSLNDCPSLTELENRKNSIKALNIEILEELHCRHGFLGTTTVVGPLW